MTEAAETIHDDDRDALHILPLSMLPFQTPALKRARMIKNVRLKSVVELFTDEATGSGQIEIPDIARHFNWDVKDPPPDLLLLRQLARLPSFDVYSLRILLRQMGITVEQHDTLRLSPSKTDELTKYMSTFTQHLIKEVYGDSDIEMNDFGDIIALFRDPDIMKAKKKLEQMANKLGIGLEDIPAFLEDYGDIFLSLSYYRQSLDQIAPMIDQLIDSIDDIRGNWQLKQDQNLMKTCDMLQSTINELMAGITGRFENFDRSTNDMWNNLSAERFQKVKEVIESYHTTIGGVLCALTVKIDAWSTLFPKRDIGGPVKRSEFIMSEMKQGIESIRKIDVSAPMLSALE